MLRLYFVRIQQQSKGGSGSIGGHCSFSTGSLPLWNASSKKSGNVGGGAFNKAAKKPGGVTKLREQDKRRQELLMNSLKRYCEDDIAKKEYFKEGYETNMVEWTKKSNEYAVKIKLSERYVRPVVPELELPSPTSVEADATSAKKTAVADSPQSYRSYQDFLKKMFYGEEESTAKKETALQASIRPQVKSSLTLEEGKQRIREMKQSSTDVRMVFYIIQELGLAEVNPDVEFLTLAFSCICSANSLDVTNGFVKQLWKWTKRLKKETSTRMEELETLWKSQDLSSSSSVIYAASPQQLLEDFQEIYKLSGNLLLHQLLLLAKEQQLSIISSLHCTTEEEWNELLNETLEPLSLMISSSSSSSSPHIGDRNNTTVIPAPFFSKWEHILQSCRLLLNNNVLFQNNQKRKKVDGFIYEVMSFLLTTQKLDMETSYSMFKILVNSKFEVVSLISEEQFQSWINDARYETEFAKTLMKQWKDTALRNAPNIVALGPPILLRKLLLQPSLKSLFPLNNLTKIPVNVIPMFQLPTLPTKTVTTQTSLKDILGGSSSHRNMDEIELLRMDHVLNSGGGSGDHTTTIHSSDSNLDVFNADNNNHAAVDFEEGARAVGPIIDREPAAQKKVDWLENLQERRNLLNDVKLLFGQMTEHPETFSTLTMQEYDALFGLFWNSQNVADCSNLVLKMPKSIRKNLPLGWLLHLVSAEMRSNHFSMVDELLTCIGYQESTHREEFYMPLLEQATLLYKHLERLEQDPTLSEFQRSHLVSPESLIPIMYTLGSAFLEISGQDPAKTRSYQQFANICVDNIASSEELASLCRRHYDRLHNNGYYPLLVTQNLLLRKSYEAQKSEMFLALAQAFENEWSPASIASQINMAILLLKEEYGTTSNTQDLRNFILKSLRRHKSLTTTPAAANEAGPSVSVPTTPATTAAAAAEEIITAITQSTPEILNLIDSIVTKLQSNIMINSFNQDDISEFGVFYLELMKNGIENMDAEFVITIWKQMKELNERLAVDHLRYLLEALQMDMNGKEEEQQIQQQLLWESLQVMDHALQNQVVPDEPVLSSLFSIAIAAGHPSLVIRTAEVFPNLSSELLAEYVSQLESRNYVQEANSLKEVLSTRSAMPLSSSFLMEEEFTPDDDDAIKLQQSIEQPLEPSTMNPHQDQDPTIASAYQHQYPFHDQPEQLMRQLEMQHH